MLGSGLGKKVDAKFVKDEYQEFLGQKVVPAKKKPMTKEEKRAEARQKGYFIVAEDEDRTPTVVEKTAVPSKPYVCKDVTKPTKWKKTTKRYRSQDTASEDGEDKTEHRSKKSRKAKPGSTLSKGQKGHRGNEWKSDTAPRRTPKWKTEKEPQPLPKADSSDKPAAAHKATAPVAVTPPPDQHYEADPPEPVIVGKSQPSPTKASPSQFPTATDSLATAKGTDSSVQFTFRSPSEPVLMPKDDVFGKMDDEEFDKVLEQEHKNLAASDKKAVEAARRILKAAHREKAFEKVLTKEENEILARFFAGKIPYDKQVLSTLDSALDKTIDFLRTHNVQMDAETKSLIDTRGSAKAALFEAILSSPSLIPTSWSKKYIELLEESKKETEGINWARLLLCYPPQKSLYDGPEDQFGNFTRRRRHWLLGCLLGPADSKSFEETKREQTCKGMFMDTALIEKAEEAAPVSQMGEPIVKKPA